MLSKEFVKKVRRVGDYIVTFQWVNGEPAMCILRASMGRKCAFVICLSAAHQYTEQDYLVAQSMTAAGVLGVEMNKSSVHKIADLILESLDDLVKMAPEPEAAVREREGTPAQAEYDARKHLITIH